MNEKLSIEDIDKLAKTYYNIELRGQPKKVHIISPRGVVIRKVDDFKEEGLGYGNSKL